MVYFDGKDALIGVGLLCMLLPLIWRKTHSFSYLLFFSIIWVYLLAAVRVVIFPFVLNVENGNAIFTPSINLIPLYFGNCSFLPATRIRDGFGNILLTIPLGFGINFLTRIKWRGIVWLACGVGLTFELAQLGISLAYKSAFRAIDINDALSNATGIMIGYALFLAFGWLYRKAITRWRLSHPGLLADIYEVVTR